MSKGQIIKKLRNEHQMTLDDLAEKLNTTRQTIFKYENDIITNIPSDKIELLANTFHVSPAYIMGWEELENDSYILTDHEREHLDIYRGLDDKGQHTVDTVTQMEYERVKKDNK